MAKEQNNFSQRRESAKLGQKTSEAFMARLCAFETLREDVCFSSKLCFPRRLMKPGHLSDKQLERFIGRRLSNISRFKLRAPDMSGTSELETQSAETGSRLRRTERIMLEIPIRVFSFGGRGGDFCEDTRTLMVNRDGALIVLKHRLVPNETVRIINLENLREDDFRVVGLSRQEGDRFCEWGVECVDKNRTLWEIDFPPPLEDQGSEGGALLQCAICGKESFLVLSLTEINILDASGGIEKLCEICGELTAWVYSADVRVAKKVDPPGKSSLGASVMAISIPDPAEVGGIIPLPLSATLPAAAPFQKWDRKTERRIFRRLTLKLPVMVRNQAGQMELGRTENISKGGIGVGLTLVLSLGEYVTVVCPYSGAGNQIEQKMEVRRRFSLYGGQKWFYGLRYVSS